jgi:hypothetical protein
MIKFKNILTESDELDFSMKSPYIKVFNLLHKKGFKGEDINNVFEFAKDKLFLSMDEAWIIALLYNKNYRSEGEYENVNPEQWIIPSEKNVNVWQKALGDFFNVSPLIFEQVNSNEYKPLIKIRYRGSIVYDVNIILYSVAKDIAYRNIKDNVMEEGWEYYNYNDFIYAIHVDRESALYNATEAAQEEYNDNIGKDKAYLIDIIGLYDEWKEVSEIYEEDIETIKEIESEILRLNHKLSKIEKEIKLIEVEIDRLSDTVDYGDDETEYYSMYTEDIDELTEKLNTLEAKYEYHANEVDDYTKSLNSLEMEMSKYHDTYEKFNNEEIFKKFFLSRRKKDLMETFDDDPIQYVYDGGYNIDSALEEELITIDEEWAIELLISRKGLKYFIEGDTGIYYEEYSTDDEDYLITINTNKD